MPILPDIIVPTGGTAASDILKRLRDLLGEEYADFYDDATELLPLLNEGLIQMFSAIDAFARATTALASAGVAHVVVPNDVARYETVKIGGVELAFMDALHYARAATATGAPANYTPYINSNGDPVILLYPTPTAPATVALSYWGLPALLSVTPGAEVGATWHRRYHYLPCYYAAAQILHKDNLPERAELMQHKFDTGIYEYRKWLGRQTPPHEAVMSTVAKTGM